MNTDAPATMGAPGPAPMVPDIDEVFESGEAVCVVDADFRVTRVNAAQERISRMPREMTLGRSMRTLWPEAEDPSSPFGAAYRRSMRERVPVEFEGYFAPLDLWITVRTAPLRDGGLAIYFRDVTEQRRAERSLREAVREADEDRRRLQAVLDAMPAGVLIVDHEGRLSHANEAFRRIWGDVPDAQRLVGDPLWRGQRATGAPLSSADWALSRALVEGQLARGDLVEVRRSDEAEPTFVIDAAAPIRGADGTILGAVVTDVDVTALTRAEAAARASDASLQLLVEHAPAAIAMFDRDMRYLAHSRRYVEDHRLPARSLVGRSHDDVFPEIPERWREVHRRCLAGASERCDAEPFVRADGAVEWLRWEVVPWHDASGAIGGIVIFSEDLTRLKAAEKALADQRELLTAIIDGTPSLIAAFDAQGRVVCVNEAAARFHGSPKQALIGRLPTAGLLPQDAERVVASHREVIRTGQHQTVEQVVEIDGVPRTVLASRYPLRDASGAINGTATIATDITAQKRVEAELRAAEERAREAIVALERAREITRVTEERLRQSQKMEAIGQLAGGVAHDFNNILTIILGCSEQLASELRPGDPSREDVLEIKAAGERAAGLTRQLLAFSRRQVLEPRLVDLNALVRGAEKMLQRLVPEHVELNLVLAGSVAPCLLDPGQLEQVLLNLVVNSRDAMPDGGHILIETANVQLDAAYAAEHPEVRPGSYVRLMVSDTGVGMSAEVRARLFEPFFTTKEVGLGTGLGLSTVYGIVRQSGGHIWVYSEPGQGTVFKIYFPVAKGQSMPVVAASTRPSPRRGKETVLLIEDDAHVRAAIAAMLRRAGYHVIVGANGGEALLICEQHGGTIDLLLTDVVMPKLNGRRVAERLQQIRPNLRVLFMSGYTENAIVHHGVLDSGLDFIPKPITSEALLAKVRDVLEREVVHVPPGPSRGEPPPTGREGGGSDDSEGSSG